MVQKKYTSIVCVIGIILLLGIASPVVPSENIDNKVYGVPAGWTDDINISNNETIDEFPNLAVSGDDVHVVWSQTWFGQDSIYYRNSNDAGLTWNNRVCIVPVTPMTPSFPDISVNDSNVHVVYRMWETSSWEINYLNSTDGGENWNPSKLISVDDGENSEGPLIAVSQDGLSIHVIWVDSRHGTESVPPNTEIYYTRSIDGGITWDTEKRLTNALYASSGINIAINGSNIHVLFYDNRDGSWDVYYMRSVDNGITWDDGLGNIGQDRKLTTNSNDHVTNGIAINGSTIHIAWEEEFWPGPEYTINYRNSTDNGATWGTIQAIVGPFSVNGYRPRLTAFNNRVHMVWGDSRDDGSTTEIYYKNSTNAGGTWGSDVRLTYNEGNYSWWPEIDVDANTVHITWFDLRDGNREIYYKRSPDFPLDLDPPAHTNETPPPDSYKDAPGTNISVHVTDPSGVNESTIQLFVNGSLVVHSLTPITDGYNVSYDSLGFEPGVVECRIVADDNCSNTLDFTWNFTVLALYEIQLHEGWNLISVPHVQVDTAINEVLRGIDGKWNYIQWYDASDPTEEWKTNATFKPDKLNDLKTLNYKMGFWINITEPDVNLTVRGHLSTYTEIPLYAGWNLVGYPTLNNSETVANTLWGTGADKVEVFDPAEPYRIREVGPSYVMKPGEGYWVHVPADTVWVVDW